MSPKNVGEPSSYIGKSERLLTDLAEVIKENFTQA